MQSVSENLNSTTYLNNLSGAISKETVIIRDKVSQCLKTGQVLTTGNTLKIIFTSWLAFWVGWEELLEEHTCLSFEIFLYVVDDQKCLLIFF